MGHFRMGYVRMGQVRLAICGTVLLLGACAGTQPVTGDERGPFDTVRGLYGGNEFNALAPEGHRTFAGEAPAGAASTAASTAAPARAADAPPVRVAAAPGVHLQPAPGQGPIVIDANAYAAVFGPGASAVQPSAAQLMQLDSLALVAADAMRIDLQKKILACRRAGESCRLAGQ